MRKLATIFWCRKLQIFLLVHSILQIQHIIWRDWPHPACGCYKVTVKHKEALDCCLVWLQRPHICIVNNSTLLQKVYFCQLWGTNAANAANVKIIILVDSNILARFGKQEVAKNVAIFTVSMLGAVLIGTWVLVSPSFNIRGGGGGGGGGGAGLALLAAIQPLQLGLHLLI